MILLATHLLKNMLQKNPEDRPTAHEALNHKWIQKYMTDAEKVDIIKLEQETKGELNFAQENMKKFQEEYFFNFINFIMLNYKYRRPNVKLSKPHDIIVNSPLLNGRTDAVQKSNDSPMGSPLIMGKPKDNKNISDMHKNVLMKNMKEHPEINQLLIKKGDSKVEPKKPIDKLIENNKSGNNSPYTASPLGRRPKGSIDSKKLVGVIGKEDGEDVKKMLKKME